MARVGALSAALALGAGTRMAAADPALAEALFREGRALLDAGRYTEACEKLAASHAQDPASGTLINLALCYELEGRLATAWAHYRLAASLARKDGRLDRTETAERKIAELEPRVPRLLFQAAAPPPDIVVAWGTIEIGRAALGSAVPVDPGSYRVRVVASGRKEWSAAFSVAEGERRTIEIPPLEPESAAVVAPRDATGRDAEPPRRESVTRRSNPHPPPNPTGSRDPTLAIVVGGTGFIALGLGAYFGVSSLAAYDDAEKGCPTQRDCSRSAISARDAAETKAWVANVALGVGVVGSALGALLWWNPFGASDGVAVNAAASNDGAVLILGTEL